MHRRQSMLLFAVVVLTLGWAHGIDAQRQPAGELVYAMHVTLAPTWFDPAENGGLITPFAVRELVASVSNDHEGGLGRG
jgi:peptide/nickel transport system substrate-binding protein